MCLADFHLSYPVRKRQVCVGPHSRTSSLLQQSYYLETCAEHAEALEEYQGRDKDKKGLQKWENDNISSENISRLATVSSATMFKLKVYG